MHKLTIYRGTLRALNAVQHICMVESLAYQ